MSAGRIVGWVALFLAAGWTWAAERVVFVGSTPGDSEAREFVAGFDFNAPVHCITWQLTLLQIGEPKGTFLLVAKYGLPGRNDPNQLEEGPTLKLDGSWELLKGRRAHPEAAVYRLVANSNQRTVQVAQVGENLLHFLETDGRLKVGNAGWSFTLNRKGPAQER